jgi:hypothetical protein
MARYQQQTTGILRGLNEDEDPHALDPADLVKATNVARWGTMVGTRPGTVRPSSGEDYESAFDDGKPIQGMYEWRSDFDANRKLLCVAEDTDFAASGVFYEDDSRFADGATISIGVNNIWHMTEHNNLVWGAGGAATDSFWHLDPSNAANAPTALAIPCSAGTAYPSYVISWRNYLLANGFRGNTVADCNPSTTRFCTLGSDPTVAASWAPGNTIGFSAYGDNFTTGFGTYRDNAGDYLIILGNKKLQAAVLNPFNAFQVTDAIENGCVSQRAYVSLGLDSGEAVYISDKGIHSLRQSQEHGARTDTFLSWKIRPTFASLNRSRLKYSVGVYDHINGWVLLAVPSGSNNYNDTILCLDVKSKESLSSKDAMWYVWKTRGGIRIQDMKFLRDSSGDWKVVIATHLGDVLYLSSDTFSDISVDGSTSGIYETEIQTAHNDYGSTLTTKRIGDVMVALRPGGDHEPQFKTVFDYGARTSGTRGISMAVPTASTWGSAVWGTAAWGESTSIRSEKVYAAGAGRTIGFNIYHSGDDEPWRVSKIDHQVKLLGEDIGDVAS